MSEAERAISWLLKGGLLLTPFLVFIVTRTLYFPFITGKNFVFRILIELLGVVWLCGALVYPRLRPRFSALAWAALTFALVMGMATVFALSPERSFWSNFERMEGYVAILHLTLYFFLLGAVFRSERDWRIFFGASLLASAVVVLYAFFQLSGAFDIHQGGTRVDATLGNATYLAAYLLFHLFFLIWFFLRTERLLARIGLAVLFALEATILYFTATRGAILGFLGGMLILGALVALFGQGKTRRFALAGFGVVLLIPITFFLLKDTPLVRGNRVLERFATISLQDPTTQSRFTIWGMAFRGWQERPVIGWGQDAFIYVFSKYYEPSLWRQEPWFDRAHNVFLDWLIAGGILGLLAYLSLYAAAAWLAVRSFRRGSLDGASAAVLLALLAAHFFQNLFVFENLTSYLLFFAVLAYLHARAVWPPAAALSDPGTPRNPLAIWFEGAAVPPGVSAGLGIVAAVAMAFALYTANVKPFRVAGIILEGLQVGQRVEAAGKVEATTAVFRKGLALDTFGTTELREQLSQMVSFIVRDQSLALQDKQKFVSFAIEELEIQRREQPTDVRATAFLATLYTVGGRANDAVAVVNEALKISDKRQQFYFVAAEAYFNAGAADRAIEALRRAYDLAPDYPEAVTNLVVVLIMSQRDAEAEALLTKHFGTSVVPEPRYVQSYTQRGNYRKAAAILEKLIAQNPGDFRYRAQLGLSYAAVGRIEDGIREIETAVEIAPSFKPEAEKLIEQIRSGSLTVQP